MIDASHYILATRMAAHFEKIGEFDDKREEWTQYVERLDHFFAANEIVTPDKKRAIFLTVIGPTAYKLLRNLVAPAKPGEKSYSDLVAAMKQHHSPIPSEIVQQFTFNSRFRQPGESVSTFVCELRSLAEFCNYGATLDEMLRDRLVCGINDEHIQHRLLAKDKLTYKKALEVAQGLETAAKNAQKLQGSSTSTAATPHGDVHRLHSKPFSSKQSLPACFQCGKSNHAPAKCQFKDAKCHNCGKTGHLRCVCRAPKKPIARTLCEQHRDVRLVEEPRTENPEEYTLFRLHSSSTEHHKPYNATVEVEGQQLSMEIDTGASLSLISEETRKRLWPNKRLLPTTVKLHTYSGETLSVRGSLIVRVRQGGQEV